MFSRGLKRKSADSEDAASGPPGIRVASYDLQRQSLLDMSLVKLQLCHMLVEPNLCRSVLIANTVRQIQEDMTQDGTWRLLAPPTPGPALPDRLVSTDILCRSPCEQELRRPEPHNSGLPVGLLDSTGLDLPSVPAAQGPRPPPSSVWEVDGSRGSFQKSLDQLFETLESRSPSSMEDLLSDRDGPYYDLDSMLTGSGRPSPCDPLEGLVPLSAVSPSPSCKADLGELDHIVEILVET
ncbi:PREDICTED: cell division cycle-associated protein 4 [Elephantulus edwardii]|uniref:cell division cycle-associated protein 4 n=1 Tax=Elephantulus edwardii TaxID=28737 RepID=UPI0003F0AF91|nr:PREDICTED: cell division cycle-associated protein 4 [Elephantulus edwardii]